VAETLAHARASRDEAAGQALAALWDHLRAHAHMAVYQDTFLLLCGVTLLALLPPWAARAPRMWGAVRPSRETDLRGAG
jgi:hypothetical protein